MCRRIFTAHFNQNLDRQTIRGGVILAAVTWLAVLIGALPGEIARGQGGHSQQMDLLSRPPGVLHSPSLTTPELERPFFRDPAGVVKQAMHSGLFLNGSTAQSGVQGPQPKVLR